MPVCNGAVPAQLDNIYLRIGKYSLAHIMILITYD